MPTYTYDPGLVFDDVTMTPARNATGTLLATADSTTPLQVYDMLGNPVAGLVSNADGYTARFKADVPDAVMSFGSVLQPVSSIEQQRAGLSMLDSTTSAQQAAVDAQQAAAEARAAADEAALSSGGTGDALKSTTLGIRRRTGVNQDGPWEARPDYPVVAAIGADPSPDDQQAGDLRFVTVS